MVTLENILKDLKMSQVQEITGGDSTGSVSSVSSASSMSSVSTTSSASTSALAGARIML